MFKRLLLVLLFLPCLALAGLRMGPSGLVKTIAAPNVPERIVSTTLLAGDLLIQAPTTNTGNVIVGGVNVDITVGNGITLQPGEAVGFENLFPLTNAEFYDLMEFWVEAANGGDRLQVTVVTGFQAQ